MHQAFWLKSTVGFKLLQGGTKYAVFPVFSLPSLGDPLLANLSCICCSAMAIHKLISSANCLSELFLFRLGSSNKAASKLPGKLLIPFQREKTKTSFSQSLSLPHFEGLQLHLLLGNLPFTLYLHLLMLSEAANQSVVGLLLTSYLLLTKSKRPQTSGFCLGTVSLGSWLHALLSSTNTAERRLETTALPMLTDIRTASRGVSLRM